MSQGQNPQIPKPAPAKPGEKPAASSVSCLSNRGLPFVTCASILFPNENAFFYVSDGGRQKA